MPVSAYVCMHATAHMWRSEDSLCVWGISFLLSACGFWGWKLDFQAWLVACTNKPFLNVWVGFVCFCCCFIVMFWIPSHAHVLRGTVPFLAATLNVYRRCKFPAVLSYPQPPSALSWASNRSFRKHRTWLRHTGVKYHLPSRWSVCCHVLFSAPHCGSLTYKFRCPKVGRKSEYPLSL